MSTKREIVIESFGGKNDKLPAYKITKGRVPKAQTAENCVLDSDGGIVTKAGGRTELVALDNDTWTTQYEANELPTAATPVWVKTGTFDTEEIDPAGFLHLSHAPAGTETVFYDRNPTLDNDNGTTAEINVKIEAAASGSPRVILFIYDGTRSDSIRIDGSGTFGHRVSIISSADSYIFDTEDDYHTYTFHLKKSVSWLEVDGVLRLMGTPSLDATAAEIRFGMTVIAGASLECRIDHVYYQTTARISVDRLVSLHQFEAREGNTSLIAGTGTGLFEITDIDETTPTENIIITGLNSNYRTAMINHFGKAYIFNGFNIPMVYDTRSITLLDEDTAGYNVPKGRYPVLYQNLIFLFNLQDLPNGYAFTRLVDDTGVVIEPDSLNSGDRDAWPRERQFELPKGRSITGAIAWPESRALLITQEDRLWIHEGGDPIEMQATLTEQKENVGCLSHESMAIYQGMALFLGVEHGKEKGVFAATPDGNVERISSDLDTTFSSIRVPILRHQLATYERDFESGTFSNTETPSTDEDSVQLTGTNTSGTWTSPVYYAEDLIEWGTLEATVTLDTTNFKSSVTFEVRSGTTAGGLGSYTSFLDGERISESSSNKYFQVRATLTRQGVDADTPSLPDSPELNSVRVSWLVGGEWQEMPWAVVSNDRYYLFCSDGDSSGSGFLLGYGTKYNNRCFVFQRVEREGGFTWDWTELSEDRWNISCVTYLRDNLYGGSSKDDKIFELDTTQADDGADITFKYKTGIYRAENPAMWNRIDRRVYVETEGADSFDFIIYRDGGTAQTFSQVGRGTSRIKTEIAMPEGQSFSELEIEIDETVDGDFKLHRIEIPYREYPGRRLS